MKNFFCICIILSLFIAPIRAQTETTITIHQSTVNRFFKTLGPISGTSLVRNSTFTWTATNPEITITKNDSVLFKTDISIKSIDGFTYSSIATGQIELDYNSEENIVIGRIKKAEFEIALTLFGAKFPITSVDITKYYTSNLSFPIPLPATKNSTIILPDGTQKTILIKSVDRKLRLEPEHLVLTANWEFENTK